MVQWVLMASADPRVAIRDIRLGRVDASADTFQALQLPRDDGLAVEAARERPEVVVKLLRKEPGAPLRILAPSPDDPKLEAVTWESLAASLARTRKSIPDDVRARGRVATPPPGLVTFDEALRLIAAFRQAGFEDVELEGAPLR